LVTENGQREPARMKNLSSLSFIETL